MSYSVTADIVAELTKKYGSNIEVEHFIQDLFTSIVNKTLNEGGCGIRGLGSFASFVTYSGKSNKNVVRFKFKLSNAFRKRITNDEYLLNNLPVKSQYAFSEVNESKCNHELKLENIRTTKEAMRFGKAKEDEFKHSQLVLDLINDLKNNDIDDEDDND